MIYNLPRGKAKFEETWVLNESPNWRTFYNISQTSSLTGSVPIKFVSDNTKFDSINVHST